MAINSVGPTGITVIGHVLDSNPKHFERALQQYDKLLYIKWNPKKYAGYGCWEIRRKPENKTAVFKTVFSGQKVFQLEDIELDIINHVLDAPYLNYSLLTRIREMDAWNSKNWVAELEYNEEKRQEARTRAFDSERRYQLKHHKKIFKQLQEEMQSGINPFRYFSGIK